jgi:hypothetical protein
MFFTGGSTRPFVKDGAELNPRAVAWLHPYIGSAARKLIGIFIVCAARTNAADCTAFLASRECFYGAG